MDISSEHPSCQEQALERAFYFKRLSTGIEFYFTLNENPNNGFYSWMLIKKENLVVELTDNQMRDFEIVVLESCPLAYNHQTAEEGEFCYALDNIELTRLELEEFHVMSGYVVIVI